MINSLHIMPIMVLACDMCPNLIEATFYSFVLGLINASYLISYDLGGVLTHKLGVTNDNFENLSWLIVIQCTFPLLTIPFILLLVPNKAEFMTQLKKYKDKMLKEQE